MAGFQCKQFRVGQDQCAMKVGTDSLILGSSVPVEDAERILDIGTGTGLLALMLAQKSTDHCQITAIDIDPGAIEQAGLNVAASPWPQRIKVKHQDVCQWRVAERFDLIISNPPYFPAKQGEMEANDANFITPKRRLARHTHGLGFYQLIDSVERLLNDKGRFYCIVPVLDPHLCTDPVSEIAKHRGLFCISQLFIAPTPTKAINRVILGFARQPRSHQPRTLTIKDTFNQYTPDYRALCADYYLNF